LVEHTPALSLYSHYLRSYDTAMEIMRTLSRLDGFNEYLRSLSTIDGVRTFLHLESLLIAPVQQIPRYILLFEDLKRLTPKKHIDLPNINKALESLKQMVSRINTKKGHSVSIELVAKVQDKLQGLEQPLVSGTRRYVHEGWWLAKDDPKNLFQSRLARHLAVSKKEVGKFYVFLFNDCFVLAKPLKDKESKPEDSPLYQLISLTRWNAVQTRFIPLTWGKHKEEGLQGLKVKKLASGTKTTWQLGENKYQNLLWVEKLKGLKEDADSPFGNENQLSRSLIYLTARGESALHKIQQLDDLASQT